MQSPSSPDDSSDDTSDEKESSFPEKESKEKEIKDIIIVGGGPIGLYMAIKHAKLGIKTTIIEEREQYTRPGIIDQEIIEMISDDLGEELKSTSKLTSASKGENAEFHIKDVERNLAILADKYGVQKIQGRFENLTTRGMQVKIPTKSEPEFYPCDLVYDATGARRQVIEALNKIALSEEKSKPFTVEDVSDNPIQNHFIAYVGMDKKDASELISKLEEFSDIEVKELSGQRLVDIIKLKREFKWNQTVMPHFSGYELAGKNKVCLYFEIPPELKTVSEQEKWLKALLNIAMGRDVKFHHLETSDKYKLHPKPRFKPINLQPKRLTSTYFTKAEDWKPIVIPIGDVLMDPDYRLGFGIEQGIKRAQALIEAIKVANGKIVSIDFEQYKKNLEALLLEQQKIMAKLYEIRLEQIKKGREQFQDLGDVEYFSKKYLELSSEEDKAVLLDEILKNKSEEESQAIKNDLAEIVKNRLST